MAIQATQTEEQFVAALHAAIDSELRQVVEEIIAQKAMEAADEVATRLRARVGEMAVALLSRYAVQYNGRELLIRVQTGK